jgi:sec-independent protein translocase protein TatA
MTTGLLTPTHVTITLIFVLLIFGPKRLPHAGRALGRSIHEFKQAITGRGPRTIQTPASSKAPPGERAGQGQ